MVLSWGGGEVPPGPVFGGYPQVLSKGVTSNRTKWYPQTGPGGTAPPPDRIRGYPFPGQDEGLIHYAAVTQEDFLVNITELVHTQDTEVIYYS